MKSISSYVGYNGLAFKFGANFTFLIINPPYRKINEKIIPPFVSSTAQVDNPLPKLVHAQDSS